MNLLDNIYGYILDSYAYLFGRTVFLKFNRFIFNLSIRGMGIQNYKNFKLTGEKKFMEVFYKIHIKKNKVVVFDVGANKGDYIKLVWDYWKNKPIQVFAFEPENKPFNYLKDNYSRPNIHIYNLACSKENSERTFYSDGDTGAFSSLYSSVFEGKRDILYKRTKIKTIKLDDIVRRQKLKKIDLLKIDTEGSEYEVLEGSKKAINNRIIGIIQFEFNSMNMSSKVFFKDFMSLLRNYSFYRLLPDGILKFDSYNPLFWEIFSFQNFIAVRSDLVKKFENEYKS